MKKNLLTTPVIAGAIGLGAAVILILVLANVFYSDAPAGAPVVVAPVTDAPIDVPATAP